VSDESTSEFLLGGTYTDEEWTAIMETAMQLKVGNQMKRDTPRRNRDIILNALGYSKSWMLESGGVLEMLGGGAWFANCKRCGSTLPLRAAQEQELAPLDQHSVWHVKLEGVLPNGNRVELGEGGGG
jgi:hypothetical protein